jgi:heme-degrading monooxygenase HmoA
MNKLDESKATNMYGAIGRLRIKPGMEGQFRQILLGQARDFEIVQVAGFIASYAYRMDADPNDYYIATVFESREAYWTNAQSPEQDARYRLWLQLLEGEPEWHDGEIELIYALQGSAQT